MKTTLLLATILALSACEGPEAFHLQEPPVACIQPATLGTITYSCEDGVHYRCTNFTGGKRYATEPCADDDGHGGYIICVETCPAH
jgi:hypothetical protein